MFRLKAALSLIAALTLAATAHATPVAFSLENGTFGSGAAIAGTVVIDTGTGSMVSADLTYTLAGSSVTSDQAFFTQGSIPALYGVFFPLTIEGVVDGPENPSANPPVVDEFDLIIPALSLVGYTGGPVCTSGGPQGYYCGSAVYSTYYGRVNFIGNDVLTAGNLVPLTAATPEPSEFALTLTGGTVCAVLAFGRFRPLQSEQTTAS